VAATTHQLEVANISREGDTVTVELLPNQYLELEDVKAMEDVIHELSGEDEVYLLVLAGSHTSISREGREYSESFQKSQVKAEAIVVSGVAQRILGNYYMKFRSKLNPVKLFREEAQAREWLNSY